MRCAKQKCKQNYIVIKYENVNTKEQNKDMKQDCTLHKC